MNTEHRTDIAQAQGAARRPSLPLALQHTARRAAAYARANPLELGVLLAALALHVLAVPYFTHFADENDNILGGLLIGRGLLPNIGFFSHHMPLPYYVAALITRLTGGNYVAVRLVLLLAMYVCLLLLYRVLKRSVDARAGLIFVTLVSLGLPGYWGHLLLAENIISYSATALVLLYVYRFSLPEYRWTVPAMALAAALAAVPALSSQIYAPFSLLTTLFLLASVVRKEGRAKACLFAPFLAAPYLLVLLPYMLAGELRRFVFETYTFNIEYYSHFQSFTSAENGGPFYELFAQIVAGLHAAAYGFTSLPSFVPFLTLLASVSFVALLAVQRGARLAVFVACALMLAAPRGAIGLPWAENYHGPPFYMLTMAAFAIASVCLGTLPQAGSLLFATLRVSLLAYALIVPITLLGYIAVNYRAYFRPQPAASMATTVINAVAGADDKVWVAPFDFRSQVALNALPATRYTFWMPWHAACEPCVRELLAELSAARPKVIYWDHTSTTWDHRADDYGRPVLNYIEARYARLLVPPEHPLANFYFLPEEHAAILARLRKDGIVQGGLELLLPAQALHDEPAGDILPDRPLRQEIAVEHDGLVALEVLMATYGRQNYGPVVFRLRPLDGPQAGVDLAGATVDAATVKDDAYFSLPAPRPLARGRYELLIEAPAATPENCVTAWMQTGDPYPQGRLTLGDQPLGGDLAFRLVYGST
jgi:hypothetical protein